ncbi:MAG: DNA polymerase I [Bacillota bacterium]|nr:MAG: DNA polymerase I [Bacillota bacterium]
MPRLFLLDGHSLAFRAFYAIDVVLSTKDGRPTNAVYGFALMMNKLIEQYQPEYVVAAFDRGKPTIRLKRYAEYKAQREKTPPELSLQFDYIKQLLQAMGVPIYEVDGHEADDVIGTLSLLAEGAGIDTVIVTSDRDSLQLVSPKVKVMLTRKGVTEIELMGEEEVFAKYSLKPKQLIDLKALMGDASDNIKGVRGIGEKTGLALLQQFGTLEEIYNRIDEVTKARVKELLTAGEEDAQLSKYLATIVRDVDLGFDLSQFKRLEQDTPGLAKVYRDLELHSMLNRLEQGAILGEPTSLQQLTLDVTVTKNIDEIAKSCRALVAGEDPLGVSFGADFGIAIAQGGQVTVFSPDDQGLAPELSQILSSSRLKVVRGHKQLEVTLRQKGHSLGENVFDVELAAYLLDPSRLSYTTSELAERFLQRAVNDQAGEAAALVDLYPVLLAELMEKGVDRLYTEVEAPLSRVLASMELTGIAVDVDVLKAMEQGTDSRLRVIMESIYALAGGEFNIASPKQLGFVLFEKLGLPILKKNKTGYSTDAEVLEALADQHEIVSKILEYRTLAKLKSTYLEGLQKVIDKHGKVHTTYNQTVTATGRLSSTEPNLQNIPIRLEEGRLIRRAFKPSAGYDKILAVDYSQIELRILAHLSRDPILTEAFCTGEDIHRRTAAEVFGVNKAEVTREMRDRAKAVNFGIVYGISDYGLSRDIKVTRGEARAYISNYFARYSGVKCYIEGVIAEAKSKGYVTTLLNRRRYLPDINSKNFNLRSFAERTAMNTPIQGTAADLIKLAMVRVHDEIVRLKLKSRMILQVHDELIFEATDDELPLLKNLVRSTMENALELSVPLTVDLKVGDNWYNVEKV